ncbi:hypothetical protein [Actinomadura fibrosa]|uniref:Uncharacterized protein n=1 Tax=Actinomadura fibrosa TaxID=111802 RepID=A0ABW2XBH7_9ACTN|nr:hypothetical protein [Actinomadura fibrosa]
MSSFGVFEVGVVVLGGAALTAAAGAAVAGAAVTAAGGAMAAFGEHMEARYAQWLAEQEARSEWERAALRVVDRNARLTVLAAECATAATGAAEAMTAAAPALPPPLSPAGRPIEELDAWCASVETELERAERWLAHAAAADVEARMAKAWLEARPGSVPPEVLSAEAVAASRADRARAAERAHADGIAADVARVVGRLALDAREPDRILVQESAARVFVPDRHEERSRLDDLRHRVAKANAAARRSRADALDASMLLQALGQDAAPAAEPLRAALAQVVRRERELDAALRARAAARCAGLRAEAERRQVRAALVEAVSDLGFDVTEDLETLRVGERLELSRGDWPDHAVALVIDGMELRAGVRRTQGAGGEEERRVDRERAEAWCEEFRKVRDRLAGEGVRVATRELTEPGERPLPVRAMAPRRRTVQKARRRERPR